MGEMGVAFQPSLESGFQGEPNLTLCLPGSSVPGSCFQSTRPQKTADPREIILVLGLLETPTLNQIEAVDARSSRQSQNFRCLPLCHLRTVPVIERAGPSRDHNQPCLARAFVH